MDIRSELQYSRDHEWISVDNDVVTIGVTDYAQGQLGDIVYVELPDIGASFSAGDEFGTIESVKAVSELFSPVEGEVVAVNEQLADEPELVNDDPYESGWLIKIQLEEGSLDDADLMDDEEYTELVEQGDE